jgi:hypothetical protein
MSSRSDIHRNFEKLTTDAGQMGDENARLRKINTQMLAALQYALPILQQGLPETVNFDWTRDAIVAARRGELDPGCLRATALTRISHTKKAHRGAESAKVVLRERLLRDSRNRPDADRV